MLGELREKINQESKKDSVTPIIGGPDRVKLITTYKLSEPLTDYGYKNKWMDFQHEIKDAMLEQVTRFPPGVTAFNFVVNMLDESTFQMTAVLHGVSKLEPDQEQMVLYQVHKAFFQSIDLSPTPEESEAPTLGSGPK